MPRFRNDQDASIQSAIEEWKREAGEQLMDIEGWREAPDKRPCPWGEPNLFFTQTSYLVGLLGARFPKVDPAPLQEIYKAVKTWHTDRSASRLPPQDVLYLQMDNAVIALGALERAIQDRLIYEDTDVRSAFFQGLLDAPSPPRLNAAEMARLEAYLKQPMATNTAHEAKRGVPWAVRERDQRTRLQKIRDFNESLRQHEKPAHPDETARARRNVSRISPAPVRQWTSRMDLPANAPALQLARPNLPPCNYSFQSLADALDKIKAEVAGYPKGAQPSLQCQRASEIIDLAFQAGFLITQDPLLRAARAVWGRIPSGELFLNVLFYMQQHPSDFPGVSLDGWKRDGYQRDDFVKGCDVLAALLRAKAGDAAAEDTRAGAVVVSENDRERWRAERESLRRQAGSNAPEIVGESDAILTVWHEIYVAAKSKERVLITGETGTGKLLAAKMIHYASDRRNHAFERLDCGTLSDTLAESELFGHVRGAFTSAVSDKKGRFELADRGTLCLEEVQNLSAGCQAKLLAVLDEHKFRPVGGQEDIAVDVRVIAVTNAALDKDVKEGKFRQDLYGRLNVLRVTLPPLRQRQNDKRLLATEFGQGLLEEQEINDLAARDYPENVRGLSNEVVRIIAGRKATDSGTDPASAGRGRPKIVLPKEQVEAALSEKGTIRDAALALGVSEDTLKRRMDILGIPSPT